MHGLVLAELKKHVELAFGPATWDTLALAAGLPDGSAGGTDVPGTDEALEGFGRFLTPAVLRASTFLVPEGWDALDLLEYAERALQAATGSVGSSVTRHGADRLAVVSTSPHRVCPLTRGVVRGVGDHFGTPLQVEEPTCAHHGAPRCELTISRVPAALPLPRAASPDEVLSPVR